MINSVHLQHFPNAESIPCNITVLEAMDAVRDICNTALSLRKSAGLRVRLPLSMMAIYVGKSIHSSTKNELYSTLQNSDYIDICKDELNIKNVCFSDDFETVTDTSVVLNFKVCGAVFKKSMSNISNTIKNGKFGIDYKLQNASDNCNREINIDDVYTLKESEDHFSIINNLKADIDSKNLDSIFKMCHYHSIVIQLVTKITPDLEIEGVARDIVRLIQQGRKKLCLDMTKVIIVKLACDNNLVQSVVKNHQWHTYIATQVMIQKDSLECVSMSSINNVKYNSIFEHDLEHYGQLAVLFI